MAQGGFEQVLLFEPWAFRFESQNTNHWAMKTQTRKMLTAIWVINKVKMKEIVGFSQLFDT